MGSQNTVAAGGRYDGLAQSLGGPAVAGVGFALGVERLALLLSEVNVGGSPSRLLYLAWMGDEAQRWVYFLAHRLRRQGFRVEVEGEARSLKSQMRRADKRGAHGVLIVGPDEIKRGMAQLRDMATKDQGELGFDRIDESLCEWFRSHT